MNEIKILNMKHLILLLFIPMLLVLETKQSQGQQIRSSVRLENDHIALNFDPQTGQLQQVDYRAIEQTVLQANDSSSIWTLEVDHLEKPLLLDLYDASSFSSEMSAGELTLTWEGFQGPARDLKVVAAVKLLSDSAFSSWRIRLEGTEGMLIRKLSFPNILGVTHQSGEELAVPDWMGALLPDPRGFLTNGSSGMAWEYPGHMSMQLMSLSKPGAWGTYFASNDTLAYSKTFRIFKDHHGQLGYTIEHYPSYVKTNSSYEPAYSVIVGAYQGDWLTSAQIYKGWAKQQSWSRNSRLYNNETPNWVNNTSYWVWNRGRASNVLDPATGLQESLGGGVNVLWHWWHQGSYDDSFPEYFPPRDGDAVFKTAVNQAQQQGVRSIIYMNALKWGPSTASWTKEGVEPFTVKNMDGSMKTHVYNIFTNKALTYMCETTDFWKNRYASLVDEALNEYRVGGIYMDQTCLHSRCYDPSHGHTIGGGNYWMRHHTLKNDLLRQTIQPGNDQALAAEGVGENWLPYNDMFLALQVSRERYAGVSKWRTIPLFQSVYHEYAITFGNYSSLLTPPYDEKWPEEKAPDNAETPLDPEFNKQFLMEQARSYVWGMQPMIANYQPTLDTLRSKEMNYVRRLAKVRNTGLPYFLRGEYLRPPILEMPEEDIIISKLSIYAGQNEKVTRLEDRYPTVYHSAWRAPNKSVAIAFASIDENVFPVHISLQAKEYDLGKKGTIFLVTDKGRKKLGDYDGGSIQLDFDLPALGVAYLEVVPAKTT